MSDRAVGAIHSRFAVRHAHALYVNAGIGSRLLALRRNHRLALAKYRSLNQRKYKTAKELEAKFSISTEGRQLENKISRLEIREEILGAVIGGFDDIVKAASREMTRRDSERAPRD